MIAQGSGRGAIGTTGRCPAIPAGGFSAELARQLADVERQLGARWQHVRRDAEVQTNNGLLHRLDKHCLFDENDFLESVKCPY